MLSSFSNTFWEMYYWSEGTSKFQLHNTNKGCQNLIDIEHLVSRKLYIMYQLPNIRPHRWYFIQSLATWRQVTHLPDTLEPMIPTPYSLGESQGVTNLLSSSSRVFLRYALHFLVNNFRELSNVTDRWSSGVNWVPWARLSPKCQKSGQVPR